MKLTRLLFIVAFVALCNTYGYALDSRETYGAAVKAVRSGDTDIAFMHFRSIVSEYPNSKYAEKALFATGEYYFTKGGFPDAAKAFMTLINDYPDSRARLYALSYLLNIAERQHQASLKETLKKEIIQSRQRVFLFKNSKEYKYRSPFLKTHRLIYYVDKMECYVDDKLIAKISY